MLEVNLALQQVEDGMKKDKLISLKNDLQQLIDLVTNDSDIFGKNSPTTGEDAVDEYALFLSEMQKEGAIEPRKEDSFDTNDWRSLEGSKCKAPHKHNWGNVVSHNAMICSVVNPECRNKHELKVKECTSYILMVEILFDFKSTNVNFITGQSFLLISNAHRNAPVPVLFEHEL